MESQEIGLMKIVFRIRNEYYNKIPYHIIQINLSKNNSPDQSKIKVINL